MPRLIAIKCPSCNAPLETPEDRPSFFCQFCGTPVVVEEALRRESAAAVTPQSGDGPKPSVPIPEKLHVEDLGGELTIWWRWYNPVVFFLIPFAIAWNGFLVGWYTLAGGMPDFMPGPMKLIFLLFPLGHVAVGLGLAYGILVLLVNRTTVRVRHGELSLKHGPVYFPGSRTISVDDIEQLYCSQELSTGGKGKPGIKFPLNVQLKSGRKLVLLANNTESEVAAAVEQLVERHLGIRDRRVAGEHQV